MRRLIRAVVGAAVGCLVAVSMAAPADATPGPNREEWWFDSFAIQSKIWPQTKGRGVTVALIDSGVNASLPGLRGAVLPGTDVTGAGGDGRTDSDPDQGHGTGMANLIVARGEGPAGWMGIAPEARILPISDGGSVSPDRLARAIRYAADHGAEVINISQGGTSGGVACAPPLRDAVIYAVNHDAVILAAAGNEGADTNLPQYPADCPGVIAVGAYDHRGNAWKRTQRQSYVAIGGPGVGVGSIGKDGRLYHYGAGTSQATALSSGAVALIRSRFPRESARRIVQRIFATLTDVGPPGKDDLTGYGGININQALTRDVPSTAPNPIYSRLDKVLAAQKKQPASNSSQPAASGEKSSSNIPILLLIGGAALGFVLLIVVIVISRGRRRPAASVNQGPFR